jgi:dTDP-4-dehydrorhamnose reductase
MSNILIIGKNGQLGKSIQKIVLTSKQTDKFVFVGREELDFSKESKIANYFKNKSFDIVVNCAAFTEVDKSEKEQKLANQVNHLAVSKLAKIIKNQKAKLIHISTDYVFDGESKKPYKETDKTNPINFYGETKLAGEKIVNKILPTNAIIIRSSWIYSEYGKNFVKTILRLGKERDEINVVSDQIGSPTYATDLAIAILKIIKFIKQKKKYKTQIYHYTNEGQTSWYEFAKEIFKIAKLECRVKPISSKFYPSLAKRPNISLMSKNKIIQRFKLNIIDFRKSLRLCIKILNKKK